MTKKEYWIKCIAYCVISFLCFLLVMFGFLVFSTGGMPVTKYGKCYRCDGSGTYKYRTCTSCNGFGIGAYKTNVGVETGVTIAVVGLGGFVFFATKGMTVRVNKPTTWNSESDTKENNTQARTKEIASTKSNTPQQNGEWICTCGRCNPPYITSCVCGTNKRDVK